MLSDRERETLREIQRQLATDDPGLARKLDQTEPAAPPGQGRGIWLASGLGCLGLMFVLLASQAPFGTLLFLLATIVCGVLYVRADHRQRMAERSPDEPRGGRV
jgi:hypothetical protein